MDKKVDGVKQEVKKDRYPYYNKLALRSAMIYMVVSALWIIFSDRLLLTDPATALYVSTAKGWLYTLVVGVFFYIIITRELNRRSRVEKQRQQTEDKYRSLVELAVDGIMIGSHEGVVTDVNELMCRITGMKSAELIGKHIEMLPFTHDSLHEHPFRFDLLNKGEIVECERVFVRSDGATVDVEMRSKMMPDGSYQSIYRDVTKRKLAERQTIEVKTRDEAILNSIGDAVFACDVNGIILLFNRVAEEISGTPAQEAIGRHYSQVLSFVRELDGMPGNDFIADALTNNKTTEMANHTMLARKDGQLVPVADSAAPVKDSRGDLFGCVVVFRDVTRDRRIDKAKTEFVSLASHQLRTPLSAINWYTEAILSESVGTLTPKQRQYNQEVYHASKRMVELVNALLNVSRIELGTFVVEPKEIDMFETAQECLKDLSLQIAKKELSVEQDFDPQLSKVQMDPKLLAIIFQNFLSNSFKYSNVGGKITLAIKKVGDMVQISVADDGIGIPESEQPQIFSKMFRADNAKTIDPDGTGLGLYLVKEIVEKVGGKAWFESGEGKGAVFYASLPLKKFSAPRADINQ